MKSSALALSASCMVNVTAFWQSSYDLSMRVKDRSGVLRKHIQHRKEQFVPINPELSTSYPHYGYQMRRARKVETHR
jgi:hypothetical protein